MMRVHHLNCGWLHAPPNPRASCHCLLLEDANGLALIDTGIGREDVRDPLGRIGEPVIRLAGFQFHESDTAVRQIEALGLSPAAVRHIVLTHADPDHAGGLSDFPNAAVHLATAEYDALRRGNHRYRPAQFAHKPKWVPHSTPNRNWFGLPAITLDLGFAAEILLIPLAGHTLGHCGVAVQQENRWLLHVGDAYYLRVELSTDDHPVSELARLRAEDDAARVAHLQQLRRLHQDHTAEIEMFGYHDVLELPLSRK